MPAASDPVHKGTLVCVVLKARNLPNKKSIGKQDPYTVLTIGQETQKTKPDKRGGQHPTWDEQLHFEIYEDMEDALAAKGSTSSTTTTSSAAKSKGGKKVLKVACYADDSKEPEFIGDGIVDLSDTLKTGEFDEWVTIKAKDRYAGEVYLELTFYSSAAPPKKKKPAKPVMSGNDTYGGAGTFQRIEDAGDDGTTSAAPPAPPKVPVGKPNHPPIPASMRPGGGSSGTNAHSRLSSSVSTSSLSSHPHAHRSSFSLSSSATVNDFGSILRPSSSLANFEAYTPAYAPASISRSTSPVPPSALAQHPAHGSEASSIGPASGSKRHSYAAPLPPPTHDYNPSSIVPSSSYYSNHSVTPSQSSHYLAGPPGAVAGASGHGHAAEGSGDDMYATIRPGTVNNQQYAVPHSQSVSHSSNLYSRMPQPDVTDQLTSSMSQMSFSQSSQGVPSRVSSKLDERPPQSHIYQAPSHLASLYNPPQPQHQSMPSSASTSTFSQPPHDNSLQRPVSPAPPRPGSALSQYGTSPSAYPQPAPTPSVINAQAYYQPQHQQQPQPPSTPQPPHHVMNGNPGNHLSQPPTVPPRSSSPAAASLQSLGYTPIPSPYSQAPPQQQQPQYDQGQYQQPQQQHVPRPLPSTQNSSSIATHVPTQQPQQQQYPSHLYQPQQQPSPPPTHSYQPSHQQQQSYAQTSWTGPPPPSHAPSQPQQQQQYHTQSQPQPQQSGIPSSMSNGHIYAQQSQSQVQPVSGPGSYYHTIPSSHGGENGSTWQGGRSPSPLPPLPIPGQQQQQQQQQQHVYQSQPPPQHQSQSSLPISASTHSIYSTSPSTFSQPQQVQSQYYHQPQQQQYAYQPQPQQHPPPPVQSGFIPHSTSYSSNLYGQQQHQPQQQHYQ
ncbi:hypothetical protein BCV70DRAFT_31929 [Testicularia cyperi]|uniref:C2 domain-containing protein n=1 Tax=Testicularia cyperi TaxID=1882483 RepID=A0A317XJD9_9BASI|nr:hypothetical protein BCV70DRAFT_31929 [Testicularia cyperi]